MPGGDVHRLQVVDDEAVLAVRLGRGEVLAAVGADVAAEEDVVAVGVAELDEVVVGVAPDPRRRARAGIDRAAQHDRRAGADVGVRPVAVDLDPPAGADRGARRRLDVVAGLQDDRAVRRGDAPVRDEARGARDEQHVAVGQQLEVLVEHRRGLAHGQLDGAAGRVREHEAQRPRHLGDVDVAAGLEPDVAVAAAVGVDLEGVEERADRAGQPSGRSCWR